MEDYQPISCNFYDRLEEAATLNKTVKLVYSNEHHLIEINTIIKTFQLKNKVEYMIIADGSEIRLDRIYSINGVKLESHC